MSNGLVLASSSPRRLELLSSVGIIPSLQFSPDVDESILGGEKPKILCRRLGLLKCESARSTGKFAGNYILSCDTVVSVGGRILPKAETEEEALYCLKLLSGRSHRVYSCVVICGPDGRLFDRVVETRIRFCVLSPSDISAYISSGEWLGKAGGYGIQGFAGSFVIRLVGSYTNVVGLPLYETLVLLRRAGYKWL